MILFRCNPSLHILKERETIPLKFLASQKEKKKRYKFEREEITVSLPNPITSNTCLTVSPAAGELPSDNYADYHKEDDDTIPIMSTHTTRKEKPTEKWNGLRASAYKKIIHTYALTPNQKCVMCDNNDGN